MSEVKKKRGRPREDTAKRRDLHLRVDDAFYNELKYLSELEGESFTKYIEESVRQRGNVTRFKEKEKEIEVMPDKNPMNDQYYEEDYVDDFYEEDYLEDI